MVDYKVIDKRGKDKDWMGDPPTYDRRGKTAPKSLPQGRIPLGKVAKVYDKKERLKKRPKRVTIKLHASPGRIIVREDEFQYEGRIIIPDQSERRPTTGRIICKGPNIEWDKLQKGVKVVYGLYSGTVINIKNQPVLRVLSETEVLMVVEGNDVVLEGVGV